MEQFDTFQQQKRTLFKNYKFLPQGLLIKACILRVSKKNQGCERKEKEQLKFSQKKK